MSTKKNTNTSANFNSTGMSAYNNLQPAISSGLSQNMNNPYAAMNFNGQLAQGNQSVFGQSQQNNQNTALSLAQRGISANSPMFAQQLAQSSQAGQRMQNGMYNNLLLTAGQTSTAAAGAASQYQPLQTGTNSQNSITGLGSYV